MKLKYKIVFIIFCPFILTLFHSSTLAQQQRLKEIQNMPPEELIESWDTAIGNERVAIQDALFENIPAALSILRTKILTGTRKQKLFACAIIAEVRDTKSVGTLIKAIDDPDDKVKTRAILSLRKLHANQAVVKIRQQIAESKTKAVLKASLAALGTLGRPKDLSTLRAYLSDQDESVRVNAAAAMALLGNHGGQDILLASSHSQNPMVRKEATYSLGFVSTAESRNRLQEIIDDPNGQWKSYARIALAQQDLTNKPSTQRLVILEELANYKNQRIAEWALEKIVDLDLPQGNAILEGVSQSKNRASRKATRLLKIKEAK